MQPQFSKAEVAKIPDGALVHEDATAKWFLVSSVAYFFIVGIIAVIIAAKFVWPDLMGTMSWLTYGRLRPLHEEAGLQHAHAVERSHAASQAGRVVGFMRPPL